MDEDESFLLLSSMLEVNLDVEESEVGINSSGEGRGESAEKTVETSEKTAVNGVESSDQLSPTAENHANSAQGDSGVEQDDDHPYARHYSEQGLDEDGHMYIGHNVSEDGAVTEGLEELITCDTSRSPNMDIQVMEEIVHDTCQIPNMDIQIMEVVSQNTSETSNMDIQIEEEITHDAPETSDMDIQIVEVISQKTSDISNVDNQVRKEISPDTSETSKKDNQLVEVMEVEYKCWSNKGTKILIDLYKNYRGKVGSFELKNKKKLWERIAKDMKEKYNVNVTPSNCENRWAVVLRNYKKFINNNKPGKGRRFFEYTNEMNDIFQKKKHMQPVFLLLKRIDNPGVSGVSVSEPANLPGPSVDLGISSSDAPDTSASLNLNSSRTGKGKLDVLEHIRIDRTKYHRNILDLQRLQFEKLMELEEQQLTEMERKNNLTEKRNELL